MLEDVLRYLKNWFYAGKVTGRIRVEGGALVPPPGLSLAEGQYLRITGSVFNDGLHQWPACDLTDEEFVGTVWALAVPPGVQELSDEIDAWRAEHAKELESTFKSESFGGYSYTRVGSDGRNVTWQSHFRDRLAPWRRL